VRLGDVQAYLDTMEGQAPATRANVVAALKSLFSFAQETGYIRFNVGKVLKTPPVKNRLAERIMDQADTLRLVALEPNPRNRALLTLAYAAGLRVSEVCGLRWRDLVARDDAGQATVYGKGGKTRIVLLSAATWRTLTSLRGEAGADDPVFRSRKGGALDPSAAWRIVKAAAERAGLDPALSPTGCAMLMRAIASTGARPSIWYSRRSAMRSWQLSEGPRHTPIVDAAYRTLLLAIAVIKNNPQRNLSMERESLR